DAYLRGRCRRQGFAARRCLERSRHPGQMAQQALHQAGARGDGDAHTVDVPESWAGRAWHRCGMHLCAARERRPLCPREQERCPRCGRPCPTGAHWLVQA
ncbi:hypothetical protein KXW36_000494, partial [Aspergillus fumigatus]